LTIPGSTATVENSFIAVTKYHQCESAGDHLFRIAKTPEGTKLGAEIPETDTLGTRVRSHDLAVRFDIPKRQAWIADRVRIERVSDTIPAHIVRINAIYQIDSIRALGEHGLEPIAFRQA